MISGRVEEFLESYYNIELSNRGNYVVEHMMNETLSFVKADGTWQKDGIKGLVTEGKVITFDSSLPVQPNDRFLRKLPSGLMEEYIVEDPGYKSGISRAIKPHFQAKVRRGDVAAGPTRTTINNLQGGNARVNIDSADNSQNVAVSSSNAEVFEQLREKLIGAGLGAEEQLSIKIAIDEMEAANGTSAFRKKYQDFMAVAANHAGVFGALLAALAMLV